MNNSNAATRAPTRFTLALYDAGQAERLALRFAIAALDSGHQIEQVFLYHDAVNIANAQLEPAQEDPQPIANWTKLAQRGEFALNVCVAAAQRRGLNEANVEALKAGYELVGLGVFVAGLIDADRVVNFSN